MPNLLGQPINRVDGRKKVTGRALYAADQRFGGLLYAYPVVSTIGSGEIVRLDASAAEQAPGVVAVFHADNFPKIRRIKEAMDQGVKTGEARPPFEDKKIHYAGQYVALVVAESFAQARWASHLVHVDYREEKPALTLDAGLKAAAAEDAEKKDKAGKKGGAGSGDYKRGDPEKAFDEAPVMLDETYTTPVEVHNPMEMHAATARWEDGKLIVHDSTQWVVGSRTTLAKFLELDPKNVTVHAPFIGAGFGCKLFLWPHTVLAAVAARELHRPVKFMLTRKDQFTAAGHRPQTRQRLRLAATPDGRLVSLRHDTIAHTGHAGKFEESCGRGTRSMYSCANLGVTQKTVPVNVGTPTAMRAPGAAPGLFALESAMDEFAEKLKMDPIDFRRKNLADHDEDKKIPWSSNHLAECYDVVARNFGWAKRSPGIGSMRDGREILGWGFAAAYWPSEREKATVRVELNADGTARIACATQDIGTGTYTVFAQVAGEMLGLPPEKIEIVLGDSSLPPGPISGGSMVTATVVPTIARGCREALQKLYKGLTAPGAVWAGGDPAKIARTEDGFTAPSGARLSWPDAFAAAERDRVVAETTLAPGEEEKKFSFHSFGAHCVEVRWDPGIARLRVSRMASAIDAGRIVNQKTARNQVHGSLIMGLGMVLLEESVYDPRNGRVVTDNLADYHMAVHADLPQLDVTLLDHPDPNNGDFGVKGIGEIGITGVTAAIANAIYHATGRRLRSLPITVEKLLA